MLLITYYIHVVPQTMPNDIHVRKGNITMCFTKRFTKIRILFLTNLTLIVNTEDRYTTCD